MRRRRGVVLKLVAPALPSTTKLINFSGRREKFLGSSTPPPPLLLSPLTATVSTTGFSKIPRCAPLWSKCIFIRLRDSRAGPPQSKGASFTPSFREIFALRSIVIWENDDTLSVNPAAAKCEPSVCLSVAPFCRRIRITTDEMWRRRIRNGR